MILRFYQSHLQKYLTPSQFLVTTILLSLMQSEKQVRLERLSRVFPCLITAESRRRKLQRFLDLPHLTIELIWFPLITYWLTTYCRVGTRLSIAIDRSQWGCINLFMVSLIWSEEQFHYTGHCCPNWAAATSSHKRQIYSKFYHYFQNIKSSF